MVKFHLIGNRLNASSYLVSEEMGAECEGVTTGEGMWWLVPLSLVRTGDSVFTVLDDDVAVLKRGQTDFYHALSENSEEFVDAMSTYCPGCPVSSNHYTRSAEIKKSPRNYSTFCTAVKCKTESVRCGRSAAVERNHFVLTVRGADEGTSLL